MAALFDQLDSDDECSRMQLMKTIESLVGTDEKDVLIHNLISENRYVRYACLRAIGRIAVNHPGDYAEYILPMLSDPSSDVVRAALSALGKIRDKGSIACIIPLLSQAETDDSLSVIELSHKKPPLQRAAARTLVEFGGMAVTSLLDALSHEDANIREGAVWTLGEIGDTGGVQGIIQTLSDKNPRVRRASAKALGRLVPSSDIPVFDPLLKLLSDDDMHVRWEVAKAFSELGDMRVVEPLLKKLVNEKGMVQDRIWQTLTQLDLGLGEFSRIRFTDIEGNVPVKIRGKLKESYGIDL